MNAGQVIEVLFDITTAGGLAFIAAILLDVLREKLADWWRARK